ncbi:hypothetical protein RhiirA5_435088 [Rhizophagus irregularis]|uniref:Uncharacterized protein n=1 Tax=Rhizophagus irregularis TaxID=588596 RepID=A0A2N0NNZ6_9GLOM|nr:hypothetical protein RhiirA5_435088 [Rhizophagus irregularis]
MGITPSREKFIALEGYAQKSDEERKTILTNAGMETTQIDKDLAEFLGSEDAYLGCFIRGIITICIDEHNNIRNQEFTRYIEEYKNVNNEMLEQKHMEMNEQVRMMEENWKLKEEYYFKNSTMKKHQIVTELGLVDQEDKEKLVKYNKCKDMIEKDLEASDDSNEGQLWETNSDTTSDNSDFNQSMTRRYSIFNKNSHPSTNDTPHNTNRNSQMQETNIKGNSQYSRHQSITMAFTDDHDMGENSKKSKESMHKPKSADDLKYFAGLLTTQIRDAQSDQSIIEFINNNKLLEYHVNTLGRTMKNGNEYTYVGFFTETAKNNFIEDGRVKGTLGNFRDLEWLNKLYKIITISVTEIDEKMDINEVIEAVERKLGKMQKILQQGKQYGKINLKLVMEIRCTEEELMNTWGILLKNRMIKIEPINYKNYVTRQRGKISANVLDIPNEIDELEVAKILRQTGARYWYKSNNKNKRSSNFYLVFFGQKQEDDNKAIFVNKEVIFVNKEDTTVDTKDKVTTEVSKTERDVISARRIITMRTNATSIITTTTTRTNTEVTGKKTKTDRSDKKEVDTIMKETLISNHNTTTTTITTDTTAGCYLLLCVWVLLLSMTIILEKMTEWRIEDTNKKNITDNTTTMTTTDKIQENIPNTAATVAEAMTEIGMKETDSIIGVE